MAKEIEIHNLSKRFGKRVIFRNVSLDINKGDFVAITGSSGCGKSTLLNMIGLMEEISSGSIKIEGRRLPEIKSKRATKLRREKINYLFQSYGLINDFTVLQNLLLSMNYVKMSRKEKVKRISKVLERVGLLDLMNEKVNTLSGGEQQRSAVARAIVKPGNLILADEPTGALDSKNAEITMKLLIDLNSEGKTILLVTHDLAIAKMCNKVVKIANHSIVI